MPEISLDSLPSLLKENKEIEHEVNRLVKEYLMKMHLKGWSIIEGAKRWINRNHFLIQAPVKDSSLGGFILFKRNKHIFYLNTWQPRVYQNFVLFHEIYHAISSNYQKDLDFFHLVELDQEDKIALNQDREERKADYFASLLLLDTDEVISFYRSLDEEPEIKKIFYTMYRFSAPYKAVLIRLFELSLIDSNTLESLFEQKFDFEKEFRDLGLDTYLLQRSLVIKFDDLEDKMKESSLPEVAKEKNWETLESVKNYFAKIL